MKNEKDQSQSNESKNVPNVSIVILNWNGWRDTIECLGSLQNLDYSNYEIVIVDNRSTDDSVEQITNYKLQITNLTLIANRENLGFSGGNNKGITYAMEHGADYILILNNDTTVEKKFLKEMVQLASQSPEYGMVGAMIYFADDPKRIWHAGGGLFNWFTGSTPNDYNKIDQAGTVPVRGDCPRELDFVTAACALVKRGVIEKIGMLDERFFLYYEDVEWSLRAREAGYKLVYAPKAKVYHKVHAATSKLADPVIWYYHVRNVLLTVRLHAPLYLKPFIYAWALWRWWVKQYIKQLVWHSRRKEARFIRQGLRDFWKGQFGQIKNG